MTQTRAAKRLSDWAGSARGSMQDAVEHPGDSEAADRIFRVGMVARAVIYLIISVIGFRIAVAGFGPPSNTTDKAASTTGAIAELQQAPGGFVLLLAVAAGFAAYALFMVYDAVIRARREDSTAMVWGQRLLSLWGVLLYGVGCAYVISILTTPSPRSGSSAKSQRRAAGYADRVLSYPGGRWVLGAFGVVLFICAVGLLRRAITHNFDDRLRRADMRPWQWRTALVIGSIGNYGRTIAFAVVGGFIVDAAVTRDPSKGQGLDGSLRSLADTAWGPFVIVAICTGLVCYGCYVLIEGRWRRT